MATDWAESVKKYDPAADDAVIAKIVSYCGIALRSRDSSLVSFSDEEEVARVRNNYLKKKLGLTAPAADLDAAIAAVGAQMKGDRNKNRVTVYYLLAKHFDKLSVFTKAAAGKAAAAGEGDAPKRGGRRSAKAGHAGQKTITVEQTRSPARRPAIQQATLIGLGLNKIGRRSTLVDNPSVRGMIGRVRHMIRIVEGG